MTIAAHSAAPTAGETRWQSPFSHTGTCVSLSITDFDRTGMTAETNKHLVIAYRKHQFVDSCQLTGFEGTHGLHLSNAASDRKHQVRLVHILQERIGIYCFSFIKDRLQEQLVVRVSNAIII